MADSMVAGMVALGAWVASGISPAAVVPTNVTAAPRPPLPAESGSPLRIDCPVLDNESRAAFEARARAEMALLPQPAGEIAVACERQAAHVGWHAANGWSGHRVVGLNSDSATVVDSLLGAVHALRTGSLTSPPPLASDAEMPAPAPPAVVRVAARASTRAPGLRVGLEAALYGEVWEGSMAGGVEGQGGLRFDTRSRWELALTGGWGRGMEPAAGIQARTWSVLVGVAHIPVRNLEVETGVLWRSLTFTHDLSGEQHGSSTAGIYGAVRYVLARGRFAVAVGPHLSLLASQIVIDQDGTEVFRVPRFVTGLSVGGRVDLNR